MTRAKQRSWPFHEWFAAWSGILDEHANIARDRFLNIESERVNRGLLPVYKRNLDPSDIVVFRRVIRWRFVQRLIVVNRMILELEVSSSLANGVDELFLEFGIETTGMSYGRIE